MSLLTIEARRCHLLTKFGVNNTALLIRQAAQHGLMQRSKEFEVKTEVTIL